MFISNKIYHQADDRLLAFFHAQRTGGSQFKQFLRRAFGDTRVYAPQTVGNFLSWSRIDTKALAGSTVYAGHENFEPKVLPGRAILPMTLLRDPAIRCLSLHRHCSSRPDHQLYELACKSDSLTFYREASEINPYYFNNTQCLRVCGSTSFERAEKCIQEHFFAVVTIDEVHDFARHISVLFGIDGRLPEKRAADAASNYDQISDEFRNAVYEANADDLKLYLKYSISSH